ncbi:MAG TPA: cyclase family protein [Longimicrobium sp.]|nr:cyclase family protein [Longimicrobium sp.]
MRHAALLVLCSTVTACAHAGGVPISAHRMVDLTHAFGERTLYWPTATSGFTLDRQSYGTTPGGWFYASNAFCAPEHGGTHLDAPVHFFEGRQTADQVPLDRLIAPAVVIDVRDRTATDADYRLTVEDVEAWERRHGRIAAGTIVLLNTGWSTRWPDRRRYFGDDAPGDASRLHFPSYGEDAARLLVQERRVAALGVDAASIDYGQSSDFRVHRVAAEANVPGLENLTNLDQLPPRGATVIALPMKIESGSGGPLRAVALVRE